MRALALLLCSCASLSAPLGPPSSSDTVCGQVGPIVVRVNPHNARTHCKEAIEVTNEAYVELSLSGHILKERWDVLFRYGYLGFADVEFTTAAYGPPGSIPESGCNPIEAVGMTYPGLRAIIIQETRPRSILHELMHASLSSSDGWTGDQHSEFCRLGFDKLEHEFTGLPVRYCQ